MNWGGDRSLTERSGFEIVGPFRDDLSHLVDLGIGSIDEFQTNARQMLDLYFPVPPVFK
jgi:hypothetical protein